MSEYIVPPKMKADRSEKTNSRCKSSGDVAWGDNAAFGGGESVRVASFCNGLPEEAGLRLSDGVGSGIFDKPQ